MSNPIDLSTRSIDELRTMVVNARRKGGAHDLLRDLATELAKRGSTRKIDFRDFRWRPETVEEALKPFSELAARVPESKRKSYVSAGGRARKANDDPDWYWIDSYSAFKTENRNAAFFAYVRRPGEEVFFVLNVDKQDERQYGPDELESALERWRELVEEQLALH